MNNRSCSKGFLSASRPWSSVSFQGHRTTPTINSISLEKDRYDKINLIIAGTDMKVIALCMSDDGISFTVDDCIKIADELVGGLFKNNVAVGNIFVDPLVQPVSVDNTFGVEFVKAIEKIVETFPRIHTVCGLSNISSGLTARKFMNQAFTTMAIDKGLDGAIINTLDRRMMANIIATEALAGRDNFCMNYLKAFRAGVFE